MVVEADLGPIIEPGGHLQWQEVNLEGIVVATAKAGLVQSAMDQLLKEINAFGIGR